MTGATAPAHDGGLTEGPEGLSANRPRTWTAKLQTLHTLRQSPAATGMTEGSEGSQVNRPHARTRTLPTLQTLRHDRPTAPAHSRQAIRRASIKETYGHPNPHSS